MKQCMLLLLACVCTHGAPVDPMKPGSCQDPSTLGAAELALTKINQDRKQGYVFSLHRLSNVNQMQHGPTGVVFYLTLDVLETKCHVLSKRDWKSCEVRQTHDTPVYGQCKATIYINKVQRVVRLYSYSCSMRPAPMSKISQICPDCPSQIPSDDESVANTVKMSLEKYNRESKNLNYFALLNITRASSQGGIAVFYFVEFTIQETICSNSTDVTEAAKCAMMDCEFAHKGHCTGSHSQSHGQEYVTVKCDIYEPEEAEKEKRRHLLGGEHGHSHNHTHEHIHDHNHDHAHDHDHDHAHDHDHDHAHDHAHTHNHTHEHIHDHAHDHSHDHTHYHVHTHAHDNSHDHAHDHVHDHVHDHAHDHTHDHAHDHSHDHSHDHAHDHAHEHIHDRAHDHSHDHSHDHTHNHTHEHIHDHDHDHSHDHAHNHTHDHAHNHTHEHIHEYGDHHHHYYHNHEHSHNHTHEHIHEYGDHHHHYYHNHEHSHNHTHEHIHEYGDHHHHYYHNHEHSHNHTHEHEHKHSHEHKHQHLHSHEHHHHHHDHDHHSLVKSPKGMVRYLPDVDQPAIMPSFPDEPDVSNPGHAVTLPVFPDGERPEEKEPVILPFPSTVSPQCPAKPKSEVSLIKELFAEDPIFNN